jgi:hypothetical protein
MVIVTALATIVLAIVIVLTRIARASAQLAREFSVLRATSVVLVVSIAIGAVALLGKALPGYVWPLVGGGLAFAMLIPRLGDRHERANDEGDSE